jgi:alpha-ribazole phosphatase
MEGETFLWLIRHATVDGIPGTIHAPDAPADLGNRTTIAALRRALPPGASSHASPSRRTVETARALGLDPVLQSEFAEQDFGDWIGQRHDTLAASGGEAYARFWNDPAKARPPAGESFAEQIARVRRGLAGIGAGPAVVVVHSGTIRAALAIALDLAPEAALRFVIDPLSVTRIDLLPAGWRVVSVNQRIA